MEFQELKNRAKAIQGKYKEFNTKNGQDEWDASAYTQGLVGDVGDLMKLVMARNNLRKAEDLDKSWLTSF